MEHKAKRVESLPEGLQQVALVDAGTAAAVGEMSRSWWYSQVRAGTAPAPVASGPRTARWRLSDVRAFWEKQAAAGEANQQARERMTAQAQKARRARQTRAETAVPAT